MQFKKALEGDDSQHIQTFLQAAGAMRLSLKNNLCIRANPDRELGVLSPLEAHF